MSNLNCLLRLFASVSSNLLQGVRRKEKLEFSHRFAIYCRHNAIQSKGYLLEANFRREPLEL